MQSFETRNCDLISFRRGHTNRHLFGEKSETYQLLMRGLLHVDGIKAGTLTLPKPPHSGFMRMFPVCDNICQFCGQRLDNDICWFCADVVTKSVRDCYKV
eukprot:TRINITY_DN11778_c0_g1_i1.p1 TRINITY_DN11778_c0_g1~~TRINITY_DN11778_c0_g1_i1.p1  ORF type:complete len:100 (-),score=6.88 TRINITY_DN11778_c0_g1_i1:159-458(-)